MISEGSPSLAVAIQKKGNQFCADCEAKAPRWASVNLGILLCIECAGIHRNLGSHISKIKSLTLDKWATEWIERVNSIGNHLSNEFYEYKLPKDYQRPTQSDSRSVLQTWIRNKYDVKMWTPPSYKNEPSQLFESGKDPRLAIPFDEKHTKGEKHKKSEKHDKQSRPAKRQTEKSKGSGDKPLDPLPKQHSERRENPVPLLDFDDAGPCSTNTLKNKVYGENNIRSPPTHSQLLDVLDDPFTAKPTMNVGADSVYVQEPLFDISASSPLSSNDEIFGIVMGPPTTEKLQDAKTSMARESIGRLYSSGSMGFGPSSYPALTPFCVKPSTQQPHSVGSGNWNNTVSSLPQPLVQNVSTFPPVNDAAPKCGPSFVCQPLGNHRSASPLTHIGQPEYLTSGTPEKQADSQEQQDTLISVLQQFSGFSEFFKAPVVQKPKSVVQDNQRSMDCRKNSKEDAILHDLNPLRNDKFTSLDFFD